MLLPRPPSHPVPKIVARDGKYINKFFKKMVKMVVIWREMVINGAVDGCGKW